MSGNMDLAALVHTPGDHGACRKIILLSASYPEVQVINPGLMYALIATQPKSWWWDGGQSRILCYFKGGIPQPILNTRIFGAQSIDVNETTSSLSLSLCESGRFFLCHTDENGIGWVLLDRDRERAVNGSLVEISRSGGNEPQILPQAAVPWQEAWEAIAGFLLLNGGRLVTANWHVYDEVEARYKQSIIQT